MTQTTTDPEATAEFALVLSDAAPVMPMPKPQDVVRRQGDGAPDVVDDGIHEGVVVEDEIVKLITMAKAELSLAPAIDDQGNGWLGRKLAQHNSRQRVVDMFEHFTRSMKVEAAPFERGIYDLYAAGHDESAEHMLLAWWDVPHRLAHRNRAGRWTPEDRAVSA